MQKPFIRSAVAVHCLALAGLLLACPLTTRAAIDSVAPFSEAKFSEVVNEVMVLPASDPTKGYPAKKDMVFKAPDIIQTGRRSRAQLTAADGTIARIGANSMFSLESSSRTVHLEKGSVLFNSPKGIGGGTIITNSATATVTGTTIIVSATPDGGFKLLVLEGTATMKLANGQTITLQAGQMSFVLPSSKGGTAGPILNFDLKQQAQNSGLVNGFTLALPSQNLIADATNQQQLKIQGGQLTPTGEVVVGASSPTTVTLATVDSVPEQQTPAYPDLVLSSNQAIPAANQFPSPGVTFSASQLGLPNGVLPNNSEQITGLIGHDLSVSGNLNLTSVGGSNELDVLATNNFSFINTALSQNTAISTKVPGLVNPGSSSGSVGENPSTGINEVYFEGVASSLDLHLDSEKGFAYPQFIDLQNIGTSPSTPSTGEFIYLYLSPTSFGLDSFSAFVPDNNNSDDNNSDNISLVTPDVVLTLNPQFRAQYTMTSLDTDMDVGQLSIYDESNTASLKVESLLGNVTGTNAYLKAGYDVAVSSTLGGINLTNPFLESGQSTYPNSNVTLLTGVGDISLSSGQLITGFSSSSYGGMVKVISPGNISISSATLLSQTQVYIAGRTLTTTNGNFVGSFNNPTYLFAGDTVNLGNMSLYGCSTISLYSQNGTINTNGSVNFAGDINVSANTYWNGVQLSNSVALGNASSVRLGVTSDNSLVQTALGKPLAITSNTTSFDANSTFANVLFSPSQLGEAYGDSTFIQVHGIIAGATTITGAGNFTSLSNFFGEADLAAKSITLTGCIAYTPPLNTSLLQLYSLGNISFSSGTYAYNSGSGYYNLGLNAVNTISLANTSITNTNGTVALSAIDGSVSIANGSAINSGTFDSETGGNININTVNNAATVMISSSNLTTAHGPIFITTANLTINNASFLTATSSLVYLQGGSTGFTIDNSNVTSGNYANGQIYAYSYGNITVTNNSTLSSYTGPGNTTNAPHIILTAAHTVNVVNSIIQTSFSQTSAVDTINANNVVFNGAQQIDMNARTINLNNINFPTGSAVNLTSQNGVLAPNPNTSAASVTGDVNFIHNVQYNSQPAQNFVPTNVGGSGGSGNLPIHINSKN